MKLLNIKVDNRSHINIKNREVCREKCENKPCTFICPSEVYNWDWEEAEIAIDYPRCIECGVCILACPHENVNWHYPRGGYGVSYRY
ncbi:4Fe-4S ferredoxin [Clostridiales bacterium PH28_bin88]|nr:4Fe-4S ferredoxin [Clostridiales bacterium PH28_bin88]